REPRDRASGQSSAPAPSWVPGPHRSSGGCSGGGCSGARLADRVIDGVGAVVTGLVAGRLASVVGVGVGVGIGGAVTGVLARAAERLQHLGRAGGVADLGLVVARGLGLDTAEDVERAGDVTVLRGLDGLVGVRLALLAAQARGDGPCRTAEVVGGDGAAELLSDQRDLLRGVDLVVVALSGALGALGTVGALVLGAVVLGVAGLTGVRGGLGGLGGGTGVGRG